MNMAELSDSENKSVIFPCVLFLIYSLICLLAPAQSWKSVNQTIPARSSAWYLLRTTPAPGCGQGTRHCPWSFPRCVWLPEGGGGDAEGPGVSQLRTSQQGWSPGLGEVAWCLASGLGTAWLRPWKCSQGEMKTFLPGAEATKCLYRVKAKSTLLEPSRWGFLVLTSGSEPLAQSRSRAHW